jgi:hypothetical protein
VEQQEQASQNKSIQQINHNAGWSIDRSSGYGPVDLIESLTQWIGIDDPIHDTKEDAAAEANEAVASHSLSSRPRQARKSQVPTLHVAPIQYRWKRP